MLQEERSPRSKPKICPSMLIVTKSFDAAFGKYCKIQQFRLLSTNHLQPQTIMEAIRAEPSWAAYFRDTGNSVVSSIQSLRIQLHPAELGAVTAQLRAAGDAT
jgi:hypothetical protein